MEIREIEAQYLWALARLKTRQTEAEESSDQLLSMALRVAERWLSEALIKEIKWIQLEADLKKLKEGTP